MHDQHPSMSFVDLNRSGVALMEIVSKPDMRSADEAKAYLTKLRSILRYLGTCDGNMDEGSMRADVNVSVRKPGGDALRHPLRDQERQLDPLRRPGHRIRSPPPDRHLEDGGRSTRKPACSIRARARPARCAPRKRRTTTATSPIPTCCRWSSTTPSSR
jgi:aspartyl-tRNA(Asn)/glutamyl-tRNA(Gln) amidotransferase subunit B